MEGSERTVNDVFRNRVRQFGDRVAIEKKQRGTWNSASWNEYYERARATGLGLHSLGVRKGQMVALLSDNRLEWLYADMGTLGELMTRLAKTSGRNEEFRLQNQQRNDFLDGQVMRFELVYGRPQSPQG